MKIRELSLEEADQIVFPRVSEAFADTFSYSVFDVRTQTELEQFMRLKDSFRQREFIFLGAFSDKDELMGFSISFQARTYELYTQTSVVLPQFRRKGIYSELTRTILRMGEEKGYQMVTSNHVASNNAVIMAKLKLGFKITGFELYDDYGALVKLTYFVNKNRDQLFDVRTGLRRPDEAERRILGL